MKSACEIIRNRVHPAYSFKYIWVKESGLLKSLLQQAWLSEIPVYLSITFDVQCLLEILLNISS
ncbi:hypothetical protein H5410_031359 [Solanum commersonii]|uniref:Uncharacterized protein n=1 Tax=Solanum commersonii TaxID=4109 RepID=A0A9J5YIX9_SOLCO|nr:hypothetical protein H5410_031359 [Solanum commersonii]